VKTTVEKFGGVDILVNNTGGPPSALFLETSDKDWGKAGKLKLAEYWSGIESNRVILG